MGFEIKRFINLSENEKKLACPICFGIFDDPVLVVCGHMFCRKCISLLMNEYGKENCPVCRKDLIKNNFVPVIGLYKDMLNNLKIRCDFDYLGCSEIVKVELLPKHVVQCLEVEIACGKGCGYQVKRKDYESHNCVSFLKNLIMEKDSTTKAKLEEKEAIIVENNATIVSLKESLENMEKEVVKLQMEITEMRKSMQEHQLQQLQQQQQSQSCGGPSSSNIGLGGEESDLEPNAKRARLSATVMLAASSTQ